LAVLVVACNRAPESSSGGGGPPAPLSPPLQANGAPVAEAPSASLPSGAPSESFIAAMVGAERAIGGGDFTGADAQLDRAAAATGDDPHLKFAVGLYRATRFTYAGAIDEAAKALEAVLPSVKNHPELPDEFTGHNQMMILRVAQGDPAAALAEDDLATQCAAHGTWAPEERPTLAYLKDRWHRAYLSRMLAEMSAGAAKETLLKQAGAALEDYRKKAHELRTNDDSVAVLEAYFAALDGKKEAARAAAKKVDLTGDTDLEDLYLVVIGLEVGGDHAAAERVRRVMRQPGSVHLSRPVMLRYLTLDAKVPPSGFTPWHPIVAPHP
jgi:hypothetical protein